MGLETLEFFWGKRALGDHSVQSPYFAVEETEYQNLKKSVYFVGIL